MKKLLYILSFILLLGCSKDEDTRIFTLTVNAIPPEGGTVTIGTAQVRRTNINMAIRQTLMLKYLMGTFSHIGRPILLYIKWLAPLVLEL